ncbi:MAG: response regulator [Selenomonadaceae bacterium]|nr:response regulator [Selenomonadaceae bacterium]
MLSMIAIIVLSLLLAYTCHTITRLKRERDSHISNTEQQEALINTLTSEFHTLFLIDAETGMTEAIKLSEKLKQRLPIEKGTQCHYEKMWIGYTSRYIHPDDKELMDRSMPLDNVKRELQDKDEFSGNFKIIDPGSSSVHYFKFYFRNTPNKKSFLLGFINIDSLMADERKRNQMLQKLNDEQAAQIEESNRLNQQLKEYNDIVAAAGLGIWHIFLQDGKLPRMQANDKMMELLGLSGQELSEEDIYANWYDNVLPEAIPSVQNSVQEMLDGKFSENTYKWHHPQKGVIWVRCGGTAVKMPDGGNLVSGYHYDVNDIVMEEQRQKQILEDARHSAVIANEAKTRFLFNMSHDIRTPMNAIIGFTDLLKKNLGDRKRSINYLSKIQTSSEFLLGLINNVLEMARIESGKVVLKEAPGSVTYLHNELAMIYAEEMKKKNINFTHSIEIKNDNILCDAVRVKEVFLNLISNAYKYTFSGGSIDMSVRELPSDRDGYALIRTTITDTGIGMSKDYLPILFEEFSRERTVTENKIEGSGLGMPIVKRLIDLMGGTITVESELGRGTKFVVTLPHPIVTDSVDAPETAEEYYSDILSGKRILLAEDNELNAEIATELLKDADLTVEHAADGNLCVQMLEQAPEGYYDLILMDIQMPNMDGYQATEKIRNLADREKASIPIIAMTANAFDEDRQNALAKGMNGHLAKPIEVPKLLSTLAKILK